jgi:hypothetical protein
MKLHLRTPGRNFLSVVGNVGSSDCLGEKSQTTAKVTTVWPSGGGGAGGRQRPLSFFPHDFHPRLVPQGNSLLSLFFSHCSSALSLYLSELSLYLCTFSLSLHFLSILRLFLNLSFSLPITIYLPELSRSLWSIPPPFILLLLCTHPPPA